MSFHVAVAIVGFRNVEDIAQCLAAVGRSTHGDFEVVICENGGASAWKALKAAIPDRLEHGQKVTLIDAGGNVGYAGGVNLCLAASPDADAWWVLNPDTEPHADALAALVARLQRGDCEMAGGIVHWPDRRIQTCGGRWRPWLARAESIGMGEALADAPAPALVERETAFVSGASMLVGRRFLHVTGPMRTEYFLYAEEVEWCLRGHQRGMRIGFAPDARVLHRHGTTTGSSAQHRDRSRLPIHLDERNRMLVTRDCFPGRIWIAAPLSLLMIVLRYARRGAWRQCGYAIGGWLDGLRNRRGVPNWHGA